MSNCDACSQNDQPPDCKSCGPDDPEHQRLVAEKIRDEDRREAEATHDARELIHQLLKDKGYADDEIEVAPSFEVTVGGRTENVSPDYIVRLEGRRFMAIICSMTLDSRERHAVSLCRVIDSHIIPYGGVTDGIRIHLLDAVSGKAVIDSSCIGAIPARDEAMADPRRLEPVEYPAERLEKEKRVLLAFECATCPTPES